MNELSRLGSRIVDVLMNIDDKVDGPALATAMREYIDRLNAEVEELGKRLAALQGPSDPRER